MNFLFLFFYFLYLIHQAHNNQKSFLPKKINAKLENKKQVVMKYYIFHIIFLGKPKKQQPAVFGVEASNLLQDKILIDVRDF